MAKRLLSCLLVLLLVCSLGIAAAGCKSSEVNANDDGKYVDKIPGGVGDVSEKILAALTESGSVTVYGCHLGPDSGEGDSTEWWKEFSDYFGEVYNGTIDIVAGVEWEYWESKFITDYAANDAPDLVYVFEKNWPKLANRGMIFSVNEMKKAGVVGFEHPLLTDCLDQVESTYTYKGELYTFAKNMAEPDMIFVNEDLFKKYSVKSPSEYYAEGTWNWQNFEKAASELTRDTNNDDAIDVFGYAGWDANFIVTAAGGRIITLKDDGALELTMDSIEAMQGFENIHNVYGNLMCATSDESGFRTGSLGMLACLPRNIYRQLFGLNGIEKYTFEWSMIPYPLDDRTNKDSIRSGKSYAWTVSSSSDNAQGCINLMIALNAFKNDYPDETDIDRLMTINFSKEQKEMIDDCARQMVVPIYQGVGTLWDTQWDFWTNLKKSKTTVSEHVEAYKTAFQMQVELENDSATN